MADLQQLCNQLRQHAEHGDNAKVTFYYASTAGTALLHSAIYVVHGNLAYLDHAHLPPVTAIADIARLRFVKVASLPLGDVPLPPESAAVDLSTLLVSLGAPPLAVSSTPPVESARSNGATRDATNPESTAQHATAGHTQNANGHAAAPDVLDSLLDSPPHATPTTDAPTTRSTTMAKISLEPLRDLDGYIASALVDTESGMLLAGDGTGVDLELAAAGNAEVVRAKRKVANALKLNDTVEDILISLTKQYHVIRPLESNQKLFLYVVLDRSKSNLAMARHDLRTYEKSIDFS